MLTNRPDPLEEDDVYDIGPHACEAGWRRVLPSYAERLVQPGANGEKDPVALAALANSYYPCKTCRPTLFFRWVGGHLKVDHDRSSCEECSTGKRSRVPGPGVYGDRERKDVAG